MVQLRSLIRVDAIKEVAFAEHLKGIVGERNILRRPVAEVLRHQAQRLADRDVVHIAATLQHEERRGKQNDHDPETRRSHKVCAFTGEISSMARWTT